MHITKLTALVATALVVAAPMAFAGSFETGTVTALNAAQGTISIDGAPYQLRSGALKGVVKTGDLVAYKSNDHGSSNSVYVVETTASGKPATEQAWDAAPETQAAFYSGEQKAIANGLAGPQVRLQTTPAGQVFNWSGHHRNQATIAAAQGI